MYARLSWNTKLKNEKVYHDYSISLFMVTLFSHEKPDTVKQTGSFKVFKIPFIQGGSNLFTFSQAFKNHLDKHLVNIIGCL